MKYSFFTALIVFIGGVLNSPANPFPKTIRVGSYNVGHFNQGKLGGYQGSDVKDEAERWKTWIQEQKFDFFFVQEWNGPFDKEATIDAATYLLQPEFKTIEFGPQNKWIYNGIATNETLGNKRIVPLTHKEYYITQADWKIGDLTIVVMSVHIPWQKGTHDSSLDQFIKELGKHEYFICAGDLNASDENVLKVKAAGFNLANGGDHGWFCTAAKRCGTDKGNQNIDNIITSPNITIDDVTAPKTGLNDHDHLPILMNLTIKKSLQQ